MPTPMHSFAESLAFFRQFLRAPKMIGSIVPTSPYVIRSVLDRVDWARARTFVEYGPGMGTFTRPILKRLAPDARLIAIDPCERFVTHLRHTISDPRLEAVQGSAVDVEHIVGIADGRDRADYVVSGLPFSMLPAGVGDAIVAATRRALKPEGCFLVYQYSGLFVPLIRPHFSTVTSGWEWRNVPPCLIAAATG